MIIAQANDLTLEESVTYNKYDHLNMVKAFKFLSNNYLYPNIYLLCIMLSNIFLISNMLTNQNYYINTLLLSFVKKMSYFFY